MSANLSWSYYWLYTIKVIDSDVANVVVWGKISTTKHIHRVRAQPMEDDVILLRRLSLVELIPRMIPDTTTLLTWCFIAWWKLFQARSWNECMMIYDQITARVPCYDSEQHNTHISVDTLKTKVVSKGHYISYQPRVFSSGWLSYASIYSILTHLYNKNTVRST